MSSRYMQCFAVLTAALMGTCSNMVTSWSSPAIAQLTSENSPIGITLSFDEASWVTSIALLGFILGCVLTPLILIRLGPKWLLLMTSLPLIVSWLTIAFAQSLTILIAMRSILGIADGVIVTVLPIYLGEVADKDIRGKLTTTFGFMSSMGSLFIYAVGPFVSYTNLALSCSIFPMAFAMVFIFLPDSPYFLIRNGNVADGKHTVQRLLQKGVTDDVIKERLEEIRHTVVANSTVNSKFGLLHHLTKKNFRVAFCINIVLTAAFLMDKLGRRPLLAISTTGCAIALIIEGTYFYLQDVYRYDLSSVSWLPTVCLTLYLVMLPVGITSVPVVLGSELYADGIKSFGAAIGTTFSGVHAFLFTKYFLQISNVCGMYTMFWFFAAFCLFGLSFALFILPETKGKSFLEIQKVLNTKTCC